MAAKQFPAIKRIVVKNIPLSFAYVHVYVVRMMAVFICDAVDAPVAVACQGSVAVVVILAR